MESISTKFFDEFLRMTRDHLIGPGTRISQAFPVLINLIINDVGEQTYTDTRKQPCELNGLVFENELVINNPFEREFHDTIFENTVTINCDVYQEMFREADFKSDVILTPSCNIIESNAFEGQKVDFNKIKNLIREKLGDYFEEETGSIPMIITVVTEI